MNYSIGHLYRWLDKMKCVKLIHPLSKKEIAQYQYFNPAESMVLKLDAYEELRTQAPMAEEVTSCVGGFDKTENDRIDTILLNEVFHGRVDILITEDKNLRQKGECLGLGHKVLSINSFISYASNEIPTLIEYNTLSVRKSVIGSINLTDEFFDSLREAYEGFDSWFNRKCDEEAYICQDQMGRILGFLYIKTENSDENYADISPNFSPKKRLKVGTFKVNATGFRLGERFVKIILDNAIERNVDEVYVTLFENRPELDMLATLLSRWGFSEFGKKNSTGEIVLTKPMKQYLPALSSKQNYPNLLYQRQKFILPIYPKYHTALLPDSILNNENEVDFLQEVAHRYALQKVYISWSRERAINSGDLVLFYRTGVDGNKGYTSVITTLCIVDEVCYDFTSKEQFLCQCQNRSVFSSTELEEFWSKHQTRLMVLKFIFVKSLNKRPILKFLWDNNIVSGGSGPRPFTRITDNQFEMIVNHSQTDLTNYWR